METPHRENSSRTCLGVLSDIDGTIVVEEVKKIIHTRQKGKSNTRCYVMAKLIDPKILGRRLREERERLGLMQKEVAEAAGVRRITVYQYEKGDRRASLDFLLAVETLGICREYVLTGQRPDPKTRPRWIDADLAVELFGLVEEYGVDEKGRVLRREYREDLFKLLVSMSTNLDRTAVSRPAIDRVLRDFAA